MRLPRVPVPKFEMIPLPEFIERYGACRIPVARRQMVLLGTPFVLNAIMQGTGFWFDWSIDDSREWVLFGPLAPFLIALQLYIVLPVFSVVRDRVVSITPDGLLFEPTGRRIPAEEIAGISHPANLRKRLWGIRARRHGDPLPLASAILAHLRFQPMGVVYIGPEPEQEQEQEQDGP